MKNKKNIKNLKQKKHLNKFFSEFRQFALQGNAIDLAIGVIIGAGFKGIVDSIVNDIFKPLISLVTTILGQREKFVFDGEVAWKTINASISDFLSAVVNFLIVAVCIFIFVKILNKIHKKEAKPKEPALTHSELLLEEIRDLLTEKTNSNLPDEF